ncbi:XdhC family protein [Aureimonas jatrophae]|uniref:Predicted sulfurylase large subunit, molybdopterin cytosine dinucleotide biosynthesis n=1 Tax=Aureimonas jatrophae TaxID=1166073 RepID=A0A1H0JJX7_9HYPH|nr:XdhC family protein [Aureimonas jatrophae]MBB3951362.1 xanthine dehydrogenase accessory factor [Aureimonas jatrophae]SDO44087.1 predicted sulfurylase large subunit, molybdopterin cytosine dinucleotide biosynthesis [Aureimonas jatrophae]
MDATLLHDLNAERAARRACAVVTQLDGGEQRLVRETGLEGDALASEIVAALRTGRARLTEDGRSFINAYLPPARILVIGAVHISQALAPIARISGFDVRIVDPRGAFATPERFPDVPVSAAWPEIALREQPLDPYTALVAVTHDPKIDDLPLEMALRTGCFYVGALGSRKTHARRVERLLAAGLPQHRIDTIDAPIGADIGASTPAEIAVAITASVIEAFRKRRMHAERRGETQAA